MADAIRLKGRRKARNLHGTRRFYACHLATATTPFPGYATRHNTQVEGNSRKNRDIEKSVSVFCVAINLLRFRRKYSKKIFRKKKTVKYSKSLCMYV